jgi:hypothetical protein
MNKIYFNEFERLNSEEQLSCIRFNVLRVFNRYVRKQTFLNKPLGFTEKIDGIIVRIDTMIYAIETETPLGKAFIEQYRKTYIEDGKAIRLEEKQRKERKERKEQEQFAKLPKKLNAKELNELARKFAELNS